jgi:hypothetical protein
MNCLRKPNRPMPTDAKKRRGQAQAPSRIIAAQPSNISMRCLMERNGNDQRDDPSRGRIESSGKRLRHEIHSHSVP